MTNFTPSQLRAIEYRNLDVCVVAGPGSGKTTVLVERYRHLVEDRGFDLRHILAITFTEKAAANMKAKLAALFRHNPVRLRDLESAWVSTIHGFCMRMLRENAIVAGLDPRFTVLSPRESDRMQWECLTAALDSITEQRREETLKLIEALHSPQLARELKDVYDAIRSAGLSIEQVRMMPNPAGGAPAVDIAAELRNLVGQWSFGITANQKAERSRLLEWCLEFETPGEMDFETFLALKSRLKINLQKVPGQFKDAFRNLRERFDAVFTTAVDRHAAPFRAMIFDVLTEFDEQYRQRKLKQGRVDFNDLERHAIALLKDNPEVRLRVQKQFRQIMLDEFQDINGQQNALISLLRSENVFFGVGDGNQSIYGFRHAQPAIFSDYQTEITARFAQSVELLDNFRSRDAILRCVRALTTGEDGIADHDLVAQAAFAGKEQPSVEVLKIGGEADEAAWIAHRILKLRGELQLGSPGETRKAEFYDFAVLCRSGDSMQPILAAFEQAQIPYVCGRRVSFLHSREGRDITALLHVIANPRDTISLTTLLRSPLVALSDEALLLVGRDVGRTPTSAADAHVGLSHEDKTKHQRFVTNLNRWRNDQAIIPLDTLLSRALSDCGQTWNPSSPAGANIESYLQLARTTGPTMDLPAFLEEIESLSEATGTESELSDEDQGNCVQVMTAHAAKGLEFNITIVAAMDKGPRRESGPVTFTPENGLGIKWRNPATEDEKNGLKDSWAEANKLVASRREKDEENRLLYVAMTRAAEHLILSYTYSKNRPSNWAKLVDVYFGLQEVAPSPEPRRKTCDGFDVSILVTESDPPQLRHSGAEDADNAVQIVRRPVIEDQHETTVTVTSLAVFGACPRKYYIQRSLGWNTGRFRRFDPDDIAIGEESDDEEQDLSASRIGSAVHEILAGMKPADDAPEARQLAEVFRRSDLGKRAAASPRKANEWAFIADIDGTILRGSIDLWFEENGNIHLVNYKTDDVTAAAAPARAQDYAPQLALYAMALERSLGIRPKTAWLHFLRPDAIVEIPLDETAFANARSLIASLRKAQDELRFNLNEGEHCRTCQFYRSLCPAGQTGQTDVILEEVSQTR